MIRGPRGVADARESILLAGLEPVLLLQSLELGAFLIPAGGIRRRGERAGVEETRIGAVAGEAQAALTMCPPWLGGINARLRIT